MKLCNICGKPIDPAISAYVQIGGFVHHTCSTRPSGIEAQVCADIASRQDLGIKKYGTTVANNQLSLQQWLQHAY